MFIIIHSMIATSFLKLTSIKELQIENIDSFQYEIIYSRSSQVSLCNVRETENMHQSHKKPILS